MTNKQQNIETDKLILKPKHRKYLTTLIIFSIALGGIVFLNTFLSSLSPGVRDPISRDFGKIQLSLSEIRNASETYYYKNNNSYAPNLNSLESERFKLPLIKSIKTGEIYNYDYCITGDKKNYSIGVQLKIPKRGPYTYMNSSVSQARMPCSPNPSKICGTDDYYCIIGNPS